MHTENGLISYLIVSRIIRWAGHTARNFSIKLYAAMSAPIVGRDHMTDQKAEG